MLPTVDEALNELILAGELNPGPWVKHSINAGIAARNIAEKVSWLNPEKAYIVGLLHDIGRRVGIVDIPTHVYEGYRYCLGKGWDEAARVCMTHSYLRMQEEFSYDPDNEQEKAIKAYIMSCQADDYDKLIQLCDAIAGAEGIMDIIDRMSDVKRRYGSYDPGKWQTNLDLKEYFEAKMGKDLYEAVEKDTKTVF